MKKSVFSFAVPCVVGERILAADLADPAEILRHSQATYRDCTTCIMEGDHHGTYYPNPGLNAPKSVRTPYSRAKRLLPKGTLLSKD